MDSAVGKCTYMVALATMYESTKTGYPDVCVDWSIQACVRDGYHIAHVTGRTALYLPASKK